MSDQLKNDEVECHLAALRDIQINKEKFRFGAQFSNLLNHPQLIPSSFPGTGLVVNDVTGFGSSGAGFQSYTRPSNAQFNNPFSVFGSNARTLALVGKITF